MDTKKIIGILVAVLSMLSAQAQIQFNHIFSGNGYDEGAGIIQLADSSYVVTGTSSSFENAPSQAFLMKLDQNGYHQWSKAYGGTESDLGRRVVLRPGVGYYLFGTSNSGTSGNFDFYIVHTDLNGNQLWEKRFDNGGWERIHDVLLLPDTTFILAGETDNNAQQLPDRYLVKMDKEGTILWQEQTGGIGEDLARAVSLVSDTTFFVVGSGYLADSSLTKGYIAYYHTNGTKLWDTLVGNHGTYQLNEAHPVNGASQWLITGQGQVTEDNYNPFFIRLQSGTFQVDQVDDNINDTRSERFDQFINYTYSSGQNFFAVSQIVDATFTYSGGEDCVVNLFSGAFYWGGYSVNYGTTGPDEITEMISTNDGFACFVGYHTDQGYGGANCFVVKLGSESNFVSPTIPPTLSILAVNEYTLSGWNAYPNPVSSQLNLDFGDLAVRRVELTDLTGKVVFQQDEAISVLDMSVYQTGTYLLKVYSDSGIGIKQIIH